MPLQTIDKGAIVRWLTACADSIAANREYLTKLDAAIGDGDHGVNMDRGFKAVVVKLSAGAEMDISQLMKSAGMTLISTVGGASGPLYGTFFLQAAQVCAGKTELTLADWIAMLKAAMNGIMARGKASAGDKTMLDALAPAVQALEDAAAQVHSTAGALALSACAAKAGMSATEPLVARKGRASYLGERSAGHLDPGAASMYLLLKAAAETLASR